MSELFHGQSLAGRVFNSGWSVAYFKSRIRPPHTAVPLKPFFFYFSLSALLSHISLSLLIYSKCKTGHCSLYLLWLWVLLKPGVSVCLCLCACLSSSSSSSLKTERGLIQTEGALILWFFSLLNMREHYLQPLNWSLLSSTWPLWLFLALNVLLTELYFAMAIIWGSLLLWAMVYWRPFIMWNIWGHSCGELVPRSL